MKNRKRVKKSLTPEELLIDWLLHPEEYGEDYANHHGMAACRVAAMTDFGVLVRDTDNPHTAHVLLEYRRYRVLGTTLVSETPVGYEDYVDEQARNCQRAVWPA